MNFWKKNMFAVVMCLVVGGVHGVAEAMTVGTTMAMEKKCQKPDGWWVNDCWKIMLGEKTDPKHCKEDEKCVPTSEGEQCALYVTCRSNSDGEQDNNCRWPRAGETPKLSVKNNSGMLTLHFSDGSKKECSSS